MEDYNWWDARFQERTRMLALGYSTWWCPVNNDEWEFMCHSNMYYYNSCGTGFRGYTS